MWQQVLKQLNKYPKDQKYIVGVSGGCDSMCLLDLLYHQGYQVIVCHVNYNLRHDTHIDYQIVHDYCLQHHIPFHYKKVEQACDDNFQQFARNIRYDFYYEIGNRYQTHKVFLGHHLDDVLETILMQKERKSEHITWGIKTENYIRKNEVYRILLSVTKKEIIEYCQLHHISYHDDYTNFETHYRRDYIRNVILKNMTEIQKHEILEEAKIHNENLQNTQLKTAKIMKEVLKGDRLYYKQIPETYFEEIIREFLLLKVPVKRVSKTLVQEVSRALKNKQPNIEIKLPVNLMFIKEYDNGYIQKNNDLNDYKYEFNEFTSFECEYFKLSKEGPRNCGVYIDKTMYPIKIRNFRKGDVIAMKFGHKKVSRLFIDYKVPLQLRKKWPILTDRDGNILLIPNIAKNLSQIDTKPNVFMVELISKILEECQYE